MQGEHWITATVSILLAIVGLAVIVLLLSPAAKTANVVETGGQSFAGMIRCALSPLTGADCGTAVSSTITFGGI